MSTYTESDFTWFNPIRRNVCGSTILKARIEAGLSQAELAERIGVKKRQVLRWERDEEKPGKQSLKALDRIFKNNWDI